MSMSGFSTLSCGRTDMTAAIVQARMTSTRLPGKVLMEVMGRPLLSYQIERLQKIKNIDDIIIATTTNKEDDPVIALCKKEDVSFFRGSEHDVLDRYYQAAIKFGVDHIVRITADCPLIDPEICGRVIDTYMNTDIDYVHTGLTFSEGLDCEILSFKALEKAWQEAALPSEREHVTQYLHNHPELFNKITLHNDTDDSRYRFTVDEEADFLVVKAILENLYSDHSQCFSAEEIKSFLDAHQDIFHINAGVIRNQGLKTSLKAEQVVENADFPER